MMIFLFLDKGLSCVLGQAIFCNISVARVCTSSTARTSPVKRARRCKTSLLHGSQSFEQCVVENYWYERSALNVSVHIQGGTSGHTQARVWCTAVSEGMERCVL